MTGQRTQALQAARVFAILLRVCVVTVISAPVVLQEAVRVTAGIISQACNGLLEYLQQVRSSKPANSCILSQC